MPLKEIDPHSEDGVARLTALKKVLCAVSRKITNTLKMAVRYDCHTY